MKLEIKSGKSQKTGKDYEYLNITLDNGYEHRVFLSPAELKLFKMDLSTNKEPYKFK